MIGSAPGLAFGLLLSASVHWALGRVLAKLQKTLENNAKVLSMFFFILGIYKNVVNENHDKLIQLRHEYRVHEIHEMSRGLSARKT